MKPYYEDDCVTLYHGDALDVLAGMGNESVDAVITDPPYGLSNTKPVQVADVLAAWVTGDTASVPAKRGGFMGKDWDSFVPPPAVWDECLRVLKPGGHLAVFAGARTQDLMGLSIRLAGFEIRDSLAWLYGSGFPKSLDVSKAIDKTRDDTGRVGAVCKWLNGQRAKAGITHAQVREALGLNSPGSIVSILSDNPKSHPRCPTSEQWEILRGLIGFGPEMDEEVAALNGRKGMPGEAWEKREVTGVHKQPNAANEWAGNLLGTKKAGIKERRDIPATSEAAKWSGWGTALKPAIEPIILARKPLVGTVAKNVLEHGTGAINIDACRIAATDKAKFPAGVVSETESVYGGGAGIYGDRPRTEDKDPSGRWPANVLLDEHAAAWVDEQSGNGNSGGASRFFYCAKAPKSERPVIEREDGTKIQHETVKPLALMQWLIRLVTPPGGTVLDPFVGSGTTIEAAITEGFHPVGIEMESDYLPLITARIARAKTSAQEILDLGGTA